MPLTGEYAPSTSEWARKQAELFESTNGAEGNLLHGRPIIVLTTLGASSGKIRKTALMRVEHDGEYVVVASKVARRSTRSGTTTLSTPIWSSCRTDPCARTTRRAS